MDLQTMIDELDAELGRSGGKKKGASGARPQPERRERAQPAAKPELRTPLERIYGQPMPAAPSSVPTSDRMGQAAAYVDQNVLMGIPSTVAGAFKAAMTLSPSAYMDMKRGVAELEAAGIDTTQARQEPRGRTRQTGREQAFDAMRTPIEGASYLARGATRLMTDPLGAAKDALGTAWDATGIPMMAEGVQQAYRGATEGNALLAAGGAGKTVLGALPGASLVRGARPVVNALAGSVPRAVLTLGGLGALSGAADAGEAARAQQPPDLLPSLMEDRARIQQELQRYTAIKGQNASRPGPKYREAERQIMMLEPKLQAIDAQIQEEQRKRSPEYKMELQAKQAKQPFLERYPELSGALPFISMAAAVGLPAFLKASKNALSWNAGPAARLSRSTKTAEREIAAMVPGQPAAPSAELAVSKLGERLIESEKFIPRATEASGKVFGPIVLPALGGAAGAEVAMLPDVADWMTLPPGPERDAAQARALDMATFAKRAAVGAIMGKGGYEIGARIPARTMDPAAARGVLAVGNKQLGTSYGPTRVAPPTGAGNAPPPAPPAGPPPPNYGTPGAPYPLAGSPEREQIRQAYLIEMQRRGGAVPPTQFDQALRAEPAFAGIPKTQKRVAETNKLVAAFVQTYGRLPTASPADQREIFRMARTLAVPAAVGVNALVGASRQPEE